MNANALFTNQDYAYHEYKGNAEFLHGAKRVKVIRHIPRNDDIVGKRSAEVLVKLLNDDGTPAMEQSYGGLTVAKAPIAVRARDILDRWDHYVLERDSRTTAEVDWSEYADL